MKRVILYTLLLLLSVTAARAAESDSQEHWDKGNNAYAEGNYAEAIKEYQTIVDGGEFSFELYYNLGNAYYKADSIGKAILYYNKALRVEPLQEDALHNLALAEKKTEDRVVEESEFFLASWARSLRNALSCTTWSILSIVMFALILLFVLIFLLASNIALRKTGFYCGLCAVLLFVATLSFAISSRNNMLTHDEAIVLSSAISVKSSPDRSATELFVLHEGAKVRVVSENDEWSEVVADGKKGWLLKSDIEQI